MNALLKALPPILIVALFSISAHAKKDDLLTVKERVIAELMKTPIDDDQIETIMRKMNEDGSFKGMNTIISGRFTTGRKFPAPPYFKNPNFTALMKSKKTGLLILLERLRMAAMAQSHLTSKVHMI